MADPAGAQRTLLYHFCRLRLPGLRMSAEAFAEHLRRTLELFQGKQRKEGKPDGWGDFLANLHVADWFLCCCCLDRQKLAWEVLFGLRATRADCLLVDALRSRAARLFPRNRERQENAVAEFWGYLLAGERTGSLPILARYDGQRPLVPWLIRIFQNKQISDLRPHRTVVPLPEDDLEGRDFPLPSVDDERWHDEFRQAAREWFAGLKDGEVLLLGLRLRYRLSQRQVAALLGIHEGNVSRQTDKLRDRCLDEIGQKMLDLGWTGDDLSDFILKEMDGVLLDEPRLSADSLAALLAARGKKLELTDDE
jgi:RNA polymerase sigma factor (sigma-70 family)